MCIGILQAYIFWQACDIHLLARNYGTQQPLCVMELLNHLRSGTATSVRSSAFQSMFLAVPAPS